MAVRILKLQADTSWLLLDAALTDADGRINSWLQSATAEAGVYRLEFETGAWFAQQGSSCFFPRVQLVFELDDQRAHSRTHTHVPLLLNRFGYSTYRGS